MVYLSSFLSLFLSFLSVDAFDFSKVEYAIVINSITGKATFLTPDYLNKVAENVKLPVEYIYRYYFKYHRLIHLPDYPSNFWKKFLHESQVIPFLRFWEFYKGPMTEQYALALIIMRNIYKCYPYLEVAPPPKFFFEKFSFSQVFMMEAKQNMFVCVSLVFLLVFLLLQIFFIQDVLLLFVVMDLSLSVLAVLFSLAAVSTNDFLLLAFFFVLLTLAACETAISLGFLVSFSRRHKSLNLTTSSLRYSIT